VSVCVRVRVCVRARDSQHHLDVTSRVCTGSVAHPRHPPASVLVDGERVGRASRFKKVFGLVATYTRLCSALNLAKAAATALSSAPPTSAACVAPKSTPTRAKASVVMVAGELVVATTESAF
jgi:hypothetical protein